MSATPVPALTDRETFFRTRTGDNRDLYFESGRALIRTPGEEDESDEVDLKGLFGADAGSEPTTFVFNRQVVSFVINDATWERVDGVCASVSMGDIRNIQFANYGAWQIVSLGWQVVNEPKKIQIFADVGVSDRDGIFKTLIYNISAVGLLRQVNEG